MIKIFTKRLPDCDELLVKYLSPWYPEDEKPTMTRPDMYIISGYTGEPLDLNNLQYLSEDLLTQTKNQLSIMVNAALQDYQHISKSDKLDLSVLQAVDKYYDRKKIHEIIKASDPSDFDNLYLVSICEFGAMLGKLFCDNDGYEWLYSYPYFHSIVVNSKTGYGITVFDWAVKKFSEYGVDDGFLAKYFTAIETNNKNGA